MQLHVLLFALAGFALVTGGNSSAAPVRYGNYYDETADVFCSTVTTCRLNFSQTPTDKLVMLRKLNCNISTTSTLFQALLHIATTNGGLGIARSLPLPVPGPIAVGTATTTNFESDIHWLIGQGRFPYVDFDIAAQANIIVNCTMTGDLIDPIP
ncbi:hypothetical protein JQ612_18585 [Bradyrhizobium manausense]|uniref:hypothetical protein n=1 Tax=Bradyrhizobium manausense TaxID=989370 RepID=UPI001BAE121C|nr:hypothetical protein [Bradyrhizobium manausense]MBR0721182.1 hypothetical protein [Bradyrhizobium manausense]MBR0835197.1 hypothetical protein [Bradyrhizobium manausense]